MPWPDTRFSIASERTLQGAPGLVIVSNDQSGHDLLANVPHSRSRHTSQRYNICLVERPGVRRAGPRGHKLAERAPRRRLHPMVRLFHGIEVSLTSNLLTGGSTNSSFSFTAALLLF